MKVGLRSHASPKQKGRELREKKKGLLCHLSRGTILEGRRRSAPRDYAEVFSDYPRETASARGKGTRKELRQKEKEKGSYH